MVPNKHSPESGCLTYLEPTFWLPVPRRPRLSVEPGTSLEGYRNFLVDFTKRPDIVGENEKRHRH